LIEAVLSPSFCAALEAHNYTHLLVQYGKDGQRLYESCIQQAQASEKSMTLQIKGFDLDPSGLQPHLLRAKGHNIPNSTPGVVISHAGSGSILDAMRISVPLIVVPNSTLLDNHQVELAEALAEQEYVVHGRLENLAAALEESEKLRERAKKWPPVNSGTHRQARGLAGVLDEEMGYLD
jgi:beta-1,4-N-acetylglucosaminyltransferase